MYLLSILSVILLTVVMCATSSGMDGSYVFRFLDGYTILYLILFLIPLLISGGLLKDFNHAFRLVIGKKEAKSLIELKRAKESVSLTIKILLILSVFICAIQGVFILYNMDDLHAGHCSFPIDRYPALFHQAVRLPPGADAAGC